MTEPTEEQITQRTSAMIDEINRISVDLEKTGEGQTAFVVYILRRIAWLEFAVSRLVERRAD